VGEFNSHLSGKVVVFADEAVWGGNKQQVGALRRLVTERTITVRALYRDAHAQPNCVHLFMATNEDWMWPTALRERRGFILDVPRKEFTLDPNYFEEIHQEWQSGGAEAFLALCLNRELASLFLKIPATAALLEQQKLSMDSMTAWWLSVLMEGTVGRQAEWPEFVDSMTMYDAYVDASRSDPHKGNSITLGQKLKALLPGTARTERRYVDVNISRGFGPPVLQRQQRRGWVMPTLAECRKKFDEVAGIDYPWPEMDLVQPELQETSDAL
jgi:hypothetical protein